MGGQLGWEFSLPSDLSTRSILESGPELVMVDAGFPGKASIAVDAIRQLGRSLRDLKHLVFTQRPS
jgi:glyoxylase-like metal-dependent hydrolase (beta-lactamase superfamily II)